MAQFASYEWENANLARSYPLDDLTGGAVGTLPSQFLVNGCVLYDCTAYETPSTVINTAYICAVGCTDRGVTLSLRCELSDGKDVTFEDLIFVSFGAEMFSAVKFIAESEGVCVSGNVIVGNSKVMKDWPIYTELSVAQGKLSPAVLHDISGLYVSAIKVGDTYLTGEVVLDAGDGIEFEVSGNTLTVSNTKYTVPGENMTITTDCDLMRAAIETYGVPIRKINNNIFPDKDGNISIVTDPSTPSNMTDYITVSTAGEGTIYLELRKDPCVENGTVDDLAEQAQRLNERCARINAAQLGLDSAINSLATQLTRVH